MSKIKYANFQPVKKSDRRHTIGGTLAVAAVRGMIVSRVDDGTDEVQLATDRGGYFLMRDVVSKASLVTLIKEDELGINNDPPLNFEYPFTTGGSVQAEDLVEVWIEGDALIEDLDENTVVDTPVTSAAGKFAELTDHATQELVGIVRAIEAAKNADAPAKRFLIEIVRTPIVLPTA